MCRKEIALYLSLVMMLSFIVIIVEIAPPIEAITIFVDDDYIIEDPIHKKTIQAAVENASSGDRVYVFGGYYIENVVIEKAIILNGENKLTTIVDGNYSGDVIRINVDSVSISGFTVKNSGTVPEENAGIGVRSGNNCKIEYNHCENNQAGIFLISGDYNEIFYNDCFSNYMGIYGYGADHNRVKGNNCSFNDRGIYFDNLGSSNQYNLIENNICLNNTKYQAMKTRSSGCNTIRNNTFSNSLSGLYIVYGDNNIIYNNTITGNIESNIILHYSDWNTITNNTILNGNCGIYLYDGSDNNKIYHNDIITNNIQAIDNTSSGNVWDNGYPSGGNFWSDYRGNDLYSTPTQDVPPPDGIGDTPYNIDSNTKDNYPSMTQYFGNYTILYEGWNLISLPNIQLITNLEDVLYSISGSYDAVQWYNASDTSDRWKHHHNSKPSHLNDLNDINHKMGLWIHITEPSGVIFECTGIEPTQNQIITLYDGWNLVGYPSRTNYIRSEAINIPIMVPNVDSVWNYNAAIEKWVEIGPNDYLEVGRGYWIHTQVECDWEVPL